MLKRSESLGRVYQLVLIAPEVECPNILDRYVSCTDTRKAHVFGDMIPFENRNGLYASILSVFKELRIAVPYVPDAVTIV